jgi:uncharacterized membrane protein
MDIIATVEAAIAMMAQGRQAINDVVDAVRDGKVALQTTDVGKLNALLAQEKTETQAAHNALDRAIQALQSQ